ncbi:CBS domain-containing protein [filamentous cyanobacterium LEGE 11480]|uniref:CBS domain-containing protein n=1 Tax=Romeriopsis navalis LEGE 11480 TaxID=2777977 RepID=A0A928VRK6_9CYAN|nr:CBS domain-containing protein [Romeriopsis navalis]MBE9032483.1 CBS domain-containing protein [Romeriopsis navalis LEGE 11480]
MLKAKDVTTTNAATIESTKTVADAITLMRNKGLRGLVVTPPSQDDSYGMITETDIIVYKVQSKQLEPASVKVSDIMTKPCIVVNPDLSVSNVAQLFANTHIRRAPVIQEKLLGIISVTDLLHKA